jgi:hypothetical protein
MLKAAPAQRVAQVQVVAQHSLVAEWPARTDQCQDWPRSCLCQANLQPEREAVRENKEDLRPAKTCPVKKAYQWTLPENKGLAQLGNRQAWGRALPTGLARLEHYPDRAAIDFSLSYRREENLMNDRLLFWGAYVLVVLVGLGLLGASWG